MMIGKLSENILTAILNHLSLSRGSNSAYSDRMPSLYHLCHHDCLLKVAFPKTFLLNFCFSLLNNVFDGLYFEIPIVEKWPRRNFKED